MISSHEITWLAGLLEGEGCFTAWSKMPHQPVIFLAMQDRDVIDRAGKLLDSRVWPVKYKHKQTKPMYQLHLRGAHAAGWMMTLYSLMGSRRKARIRGLLEVWKAKKQRRAPKRRMHFIP